MTCDPQDERHPCEFYVGYVDETPPGIARFAHRLAVGLVVVAAALGLSLALLLERFDEGVFEYGLVRDYQGALVVDPHPRLVVENGPAGGYLLVAEGKRGFEVSVPPSLPGSPATARETELSGTLIRNPQAAMLEVHSVTLPEQESEDVPQAGAASSSDLEAVAAAPGDQSDPPTGEMAPDADVRVVMRGDTLVGEIVDTKCYLGAMKPGRGKPHRDCASLCIRGGIPAALLVRTQDGDRRLVHLLNPSGEPMGPELLDRVGQPVEVTGLLRRRDDRLFLRAFSLRTTDSSAPPLDLLRLATSSQPGSNQ